MPSLNQLVIVILFVTASSQSTDIHENDGGYNQQQRNSQQLRANANGNIEQHYPSQYESYMNVHKSEFPAKAAGEWINRPYQNKQPSYEHLQCLKQEVQGNCYEPDKYPKGLRDKHIVRANSPGILSAADQLVWESDISEYKVISENSIDAYKERINKLLNNRRIYFIGDSITRQWYKTMFCELVHVLGMSVAQVQYKLVYMEIPELDSDLRGFPFTQASETFRQASKYDFVVFNIGHHYGANFGKNWPQKYEQALERLLTINFGPIPDEHIFFRTTSIKHFLSGLGDYHTETFKVGKTEPNMNAKWETYGEQELPHQNLIAFDIIMNQKHRGIQILDTSPMTLARSDASYDGVHLCTPGPMEYWSRMFYYQIEEKTRTESEAVLTPKGLYHTRGIRAFPQSEVK